MPEHSRREDIEGVSLIDGSVLVNAPFAEAMSVLRNRPAHREVDRRFVYIDPRPDRVGAQLRDDPSPPGFFSVIFGSLSSIPREQPIRDNLEVLERRSMEMTTLRSITKALRPEVEETVGKLFGRTLFLDRPTPRRLAAWRAKSQKAAMKQSGYAYQAYAQVKFAGIVNSLAELVHSAAPGLEIASHEPIARHLHAHFAANGLDRMVAFGGGDLAQVAEFFRKHDLEFRIRRLRLLARRLTQDWEHEEAITEADRDRARDVIYDAMELYTKRCNLNELGDEFPELAHRIFDDAAAVLDRIAQCRRLEETDKIVDGILADAMSAMPAELRRHMLLTYLGYPFYDSATLPLLRGEGTAEFDPVKVDRISPDDARSIRPGGAHDTLRGIEFYNFGAFFSRAYRENDYLWGRLHGAERMIDLIASTLPDSHKIEKSVLNEFKQAAFLAILEEEDGRLNAEPSLVSRIRDEVRRLRPTGD